MSSAAFKKYRVNEVELERMREQKKSVADMNGLLDEMTDQWFAMTQAERDVLSKEA